MKKKKTNPLLSRVGFILRPFLLLPPSLSAYQTETKKRYIISPLLRLAYVVDHALIAGKLTRKSRDFR